MKNKYQSYKQSHIDWIGEIPVHWETVKPKYKLNRVTRVIDDEDEVITCFRDGIVTLRKNRREQGFTNSIKEHGYQQILPGDLVVHEMDGFAGAIGISDSKGKSTPVYTVVEPDNRTDLKYVTYLLREMSQTEKIKSLARSIRERTTDFRWNIWSEIQFPFPPIDEQKFISSYLDKKITQINSLVEKIQRKIEILKEKRTSLINHCVTKGLDPNISMKDSGVEWIGEIPSSWQSIRLGMLGIFSSSGIDKKLKKDEVPVRMVNFTDLIKGRNYFSIQTGDKEYKKVTTSQSKLNEHRLEKGDMVFIPSSETYEDLGYSSLIDFDEMDIVYSYHIIRFRTTKSIYHYYKKYFINCHSVLNQFSLQSKGTTRKIIGKNVFKNVRVVLPPIYEQQQIVSYLDKQTQLIDKTVSIEEKRIELFKEYRQSLISCVVTGKLKITENKI